MTLTPKPQNSIAARTAARLRERAERIESARAEIRELRDAVIAGDQRADRAVTQALTDLGMLGQTWLAESWEMDSRRWLEQLGYTARIAERIARLAETKCSFRSVRAEDAVRLIREESERLDSEDAKRRAAIASGSAPAKP